jgi:hypothetical protein
MMTGTLDKATVLQELRRRGLTARAEFVDRQLPDLIDVQTNAGLLATLGLAIEGDHLREDGERP